MLTRNRQRSIAGMGMKAFRESMPPAEPHDSLHL